LGDYGLDPGQTPLAGWTSFHDAIWRRVYSG